MRATVFKRACVAAVGLGLWAGVTGCGGHHVLAQFPAAAEGGGAEVLWVERGNVLMRCYREDRSGALRLDVPVCVYAEYRRPEE
jgi:hypothetical protein